MCDEKSQRRRVKRGTDVMVMRRKKDQRSNRGYGQTEHKRGDQSPLSLPIHPRSEATSRFAHEGRRGGAAWSAAPQEEGGKKKARHTDEHGRVTSTALELSLAQGPGKKRRGRKKINLRRTRIQRVKIIPSVPCTVLCVVLCGAVSCRTLSLSSASSQQTLSPFPEAHTYSDTRACSLYGPKGKANGRSKDELPV